MSFKTRPRWVYVICWESPSFPCPRWPHFSIFKKLTCTYVVSRRTLISGSMTRNSAVSCTRPASWTFSPQDEGWLWSSATGVYAWHEWGKWGGNIKGQGWKYKMPDRPSLPSLARNTLWVRKQIVAFPLVFLWQALTRTGLRIQFNQFRLDPVQIRSCILESDQNWFISVLTTWSSSEQFLSHFCKTDSVQNCHVSVL